MAHLPLSLTVVGATFPNKRRQPARRFEIALCAPGEPIELRPEPKNPHDPHAIAVFSTRGVQLGYVTAERAPLIGRRLAECDVVAVFQQATAWGAIVRVGFDGTVPAIPALAAHPVSGDAEPDWFPDEMPPDE